MSFFALTGARILAAPRMRRVSRNPPLQVLLPLVLRRASHEARE